MKKKSSIGQHIKALGFTIFSVCVPVLLLIFFVLPRQTTEHNLPEINFDEEVVTEQVLLEATPSASAQPEEAIFSTTLTIYFPQTNKDTEFQLYEKNSKNLLASGKIENNQVKIVIRNNQLGQNPGFLLKTNQHLTADLGSFLIPQNYNYFLQLGADRLLLGDLNNDDLIDVWDATFLIANYGNPGLTDLNNDGNTDKLDLQVLLKNYGKNGEIIKN